MKYNTCHLSDIAEIFSGFAFRSQDMGKSGIPVIKIANIQNNRVLRECSDHFSENLLSRKLERYFLQDRDTLVAMTGAGSVGKFGKMIGNPERKYLVNQRVGIIRPDLSLCNHRYLFHVLSNDIYEKVLYGLGLGAGQPNVSAKEIGALEIPFPPLPTQRKIAAILSAYDDLIENNLRRIKILEEMAQNLYREWFVKLRFPGHEQVRFVDSALGRIPEGWEMTDFGELYITSSGGTPRREVAEYYGGNHPWIKTRELNDGFVLETEEKLTDLGLKKSSAKIFPDNTVILAIYGATIGKLGILSMPSATNQACVAILPRKNGFGRAFAFIFLRENREKLIGLGQGAAQQNISQVVLKKIPVLRPPVTIMQKFSIFAEPLFDSIRNLQCKNATLRRTRDLLLPKLISGEVDVSELEIAIPEEALI